MKPLRLLMGFALIVLFVVVVVAAAPARLLSLVVPGEQIVLQGLSGTLWQGQASRALVKLPPGYLHLGAVEWSLQPASLLTLSPRLTLGSAWGPQRLSGELTLRGAAAIDARDLNIRVAADLVQKFAPLAVDGDLSVELSELSIRDGLPYSGSGRLVWQSAGFQSPRGRIPLGSYVLQFEQLPGEALIGEVLTLDGPLNAEGTVELLGRSYAIDILLGSEFEFEPQLQQALSLMAEPEGSDFRVRLEADF